MEKKQAQRGFATLAGATRRAIRSFAAVARATRSSTAIARAIRRAMGLNGFATIATTKPNPHGLLSGYIA